MSCGSTRFRHWPGYVLLVLASLVVGCAKPREASPGRALLSPAALTGQPASNAAPLEADWPGPHWWRAFGPDDLDVLVQAALQRQPGLQVALARVRQAQAVLEGVRSDDQATLNLNLDISAQRFTENGLSPPALAGRHRLNNAVQWSARWEPDLGRMQPLLESAMGRERTAQAQAQAARMLLAAGVATRWTELARLVELQTLTERSLAQRQAMLGLVAQRQAAGLDTVLELRQAEGLIAQTRVELEALAEAAQRERHALAELSGQSPEALSALKPALAELRPVPLPEQIAADLLGRRADLVALRWTVASLEGDVALARVQFLPNVNLLAFAGLSSIGLGRLIDAGSRTYGVGPALRLPLFEAPRLQARLDEQQALRDGAVEAYNQALIAALREVADETASLLSIERQRQAQAQALAAAESAYALALQRYQAGLVNFLTVLTVENTVIAQRRLDAELKARELATGIALARALGGGYRTDTRPNSP